MSQTRKRRRFNRQSGLINPELAPLNLDEEIETSLPVATSTGDNMKSPPPVLTLGSQQQRSKPRRVISSASQLTLIERLTRNEQHNTNDKKQDENMDPLHGSDLDLQAYQLVPDALEAKLSAGASINSLSYFRQRTSSVESEYRGSLSPLLAQQLSTTSPFSSFNIPEPLSTASPIATQLSISLSPFLANQEKPTPIFETPVEFLQDGADTSDIPSIQETSPAAVANEIITELEDHQEMGISDEIDVAATYGEVLPTERSQTRIDINHDTGTTASNHELSPNSTPVGLDQHSFDPVDVTEPSCLSPNVKSPSFITVGTSRNSTLTPRLLKSTWIVEDLEGTVILSGSTQPNWHSTLRCRKTIVRLPKRDASRLPKRKPLVKANSNWKVTTLYPS